jgi:hypothetical protein
MGIRESLNKNPAITTGVTIGIIVVALVFILVQALGGGGAASGGSVDKAFFSVDNGKTWFADDINKLPPFDHEGKPAVRVYVFTCDGGKTKFAAYIERYTEAAKKEMEKARANPQGPGMMGMESLSYTGREVKKAGSEGPWLKAMDPRAAEAMSINCPDGQSMDNLEMVFP